MLIEHTEIYGFRASLRGMRNPFDSWDKSDTTYNVRSGCDPSVYSHECREAPNIGPADLELSAKLIKRGGDHRKFLRYIVVWCDLVIPRYVWQEVDTYKVGTVRNSCSTMNTLGKRQLHDGDFENPMPLLMLDALNRAIRDFKEADGSAAKRSERVTMKDLLPEGFLQRATYLLNYEVGFRMYFSRRGHRLPMWREGCEGSITEWIKSWPYMQHFIDAASR